MKFQGMIEDIDTREKVAHTSYKDMEELDFQILLTDNCYVNPSSIHLCFPMKIKKSTNESSNIGTDMITVNYFFEHLIKSISITKYGSDKGLIPTFSPYEIFEYSDSIVKYLPKDSLKNLEKTLFYSKQSVYYNSVAKDQRIHNGAGVPTTGLNAANCHIKKNLQKI